MKTESPEAQESGPHSRRRTTAAGLLVHAAALLLGAALRPQSRRGHSAPGCTGESHEGLPLPEREDRRDRTRPQVGGNVTPKAFTSPEAFVGDGKMREREQLFGGVSVNVTPVRQQF